MSFFGTNSDKTFDFTCPAKPHATPRGTAVVEVGVVDASILFHSKKKEEERPNTTGWRKKNERTIYNKQNKRTTIRIIGEYIATHQQKEPRERRKRQRDVVIDSRLFFGVVLLFLFIRRSTI